MFSKNALLSRKILYKKFFNKFDLVKEFFRFSGSFLLNKSKQPLAISLMITSVCNNNCKMCFEKKSLNKNKNLPFLEKKIIKKLISQIKKRKTLIFITGGEPFLHPNIWQILKLFKNKNIFVSICTNGTCLKTKDIKKLSKTQLSSIMFSIHGTKKTHDKITNNKGSFNKIIKNIKQIKEETKIPVFVNYAILPNNITDMLKTIKICEKLKVNAIRFQHLNFLTKKELNQHYKLFNKKHQVEQYISDKTQLPPRRILKQVKKINNKSFDIPIFFLPNLNEIEIKKWYSDFFSTKRKCFFPFREIFIDFNANVYPCRTIRYKLGNLKEEKLKKIFNNKKAIYFRKKIKKKLPPGCNRCCRL